jgi:hypothetical protein
LSVRDEGLLVGLGVEVTPRRRARASLALAAGEAHLGESLAGEVGVLGAIGQAAA